jgi:hypothetical protein
MTEMQTIEIRFPGEWIAAYRDGVGTNWSLYRDGDDGEQAWIEAGRYGEGLTEEFVRWGWPELADAAGLD